MTAPGLTRSYETFVPLGKGPTTPPMVQTNLRPGHDTIWDITRVWATSVGYEPQATLVTIFGTNLDLYQIENGGAGAAGTVLMVPFVAIYRNAILLANLVQAFNYVPRGFEPIALQQPYRIQPDDTVKILGTEIWNTNALGAANNERPGRGVTVGIDVIETIKEGA